MLIEWDPQKAKKNLKKHGVSFDGAATVFLDSLALTYEDTGHVEERNVTIGHASTGRVLLVVSTERAEGTRLRIISARKSTSHERRLYEEGV